MVRFLVRFMVLGLWAAGTLAGSSQSSLAQEWTRFRGPNRSGSSQAKAKPTRWTAEN